MDWRLGLGVASVALLALVVAWGASLQREKLAPLCEPDAAVPHLSVRAHDLEGRPGYAFWVVNPTSAPFTFHGGTYEVRTLEVVPNQGLRDLGTAHANLDFVAGYNGTTVEPGGEVRWGAGELPGPKEFVVEARMEGMCGVGRFPG